MRTVLFHLAVVAILLANTRKLLAFYHFDSVPIEFDLFFQIDFTLFCLFVDYLLLWLALLFIAF